MQILIFFDIIKNSPAPQIGSGEKLFYGRLYYQLRKTVAEKAIK